jgi:hypothetical protein
VSLLQPFTTCTTTTLNKNKHNKAHTADSVLQARLRFDMTTNTSNPRGKAKSGSVRRLR